MNRKNLLKLALKVEGKSTEEVREGLNTFQNFVLIDELLSEGYIDGLVVFGNDFLVPKDKFFRLTPKGELKLGIKMKKLEANIINDDKQNYSQNDENYIIAAKLVLDKVIKGKLGISKNGELMEVTVNRG